ncbi:MAG: peptidoglycan-binding protein [Gammaproteobacteria bacterium]
MIRIVLFVAIVCCCEPAAAYPLDGYEQTGIRRVEAARLAVLGEMRGRKQPPGALLPTAEVDLRLLQHPDFDLPEPDAEFTSQIRKILGRKKGRYGIAVLDVSDPSQPRYAEHRGVSVQNVGSVGKIVPALAVFQALADIYPEDIDARRRVLRETIVTANDFIRVDHHEVRLWNPETGKLRYRELHVGDQGSLWEHLDWMLSASSNAAAAMVMHEAMLLVHNGREYPVAAEEAERFFAETPKAELKALFERTFLEPITRNGMNLEQLRQGSFFTRHGKRTVPTGLSSYGTARELVRLALRMEQGRLVDGFSSRQIKRLLYMTEKRIRYASSPALAQSAVYFKSGSLYGCEPEEGFVCRKYHGNVRNYMNSLAIVETPAGQNRMVYLTTMISNVLRKNSAVDHQTFATRVHRLLEKRNPDATGTQEQQHAFGENLIGYAEKRKARLLIVDTQSALLRLGFEIGEVDGEVGRKTRAAIKKFQRANKLKVNGEPSQTLLEHLRQASAPEGTAEEKGIE